MHQQIGPCEESERGSSPTHEALPRLTTGPHASAWMPCHGFSTCRSGERSRAKRPGPPVPGRAWLPGQCTGRFGPFRESGPRLGPGRTAAIMNGVWQSDCSLRAPLETRRLPLVRSFHMAVCPSGQGTRLQNELRGFDSRHGLFCFSCLDQASDSSSVHPGGTAARAARQPGAAVQQDSGRNAVTAAENWSRAS